MCKESNPAVTDEDGCTIYAPRGEGGPDALVRRPGKTRADHESGAWDNHLQNRSAKMDENRG